MSGSPQDPATPRDTNPEGEATGQPPRPTAGDKGTEPLPPTAYPLPNHTEDSTSLQPLPPVPLPPLPAAGASSPVEDSDPTLPPANAKDPPAERRYSILEKIGGGQFGEVFRGESPGRVPVAIKRLLCPLGADQARRELAALEHVKNLRHPYLVQLHAFWVEDERLHIAMELADRTTHERAEECRQQKLPGIPPAELLDYIGQAAAALDYIHKKGLHHRDIKPANLLLLEGYVKVADLGLARPYESDAQIVEASVAGTPCYMPPEVWQGQISPNTDQWSLAVTYAELRLNRRPYSATTHFGLAEQICRGEADLDGFSEPERAVLRKALHREPGRRYSSCTELALALREALEPPKPPPPPPPPPPPSPVWTWLTRGGLFAALGCVVGVLLFFLLAAEISLEPSTSSVRVDLGRTIPFTVRVQRKYGFGTPRLEVLTRPPGVQVGIRPDPDEEDAYLVEVIAGPEAEVGVHDLRLRAEKGSSAAEVRVEVTVLFRADGFEPDGTETVKDDDGVRWYKRMVRILPGGTRVPFVAIPRGKMNPKYREKPEPTFYMMQDKLSLGLFRKFAREKPGEVTDGTWDKGADDRHPVFNVKVDDAYRLAAWQGGKLPSRVQWNTAAGLYLDSRTGEGPYLGYFERDWEPVLSCFFLGHFAGRGRQGHLAAALSLGIGVPRGGIAVGEPKLPRPVGTSPFDRSPFGCCDMAGNGREWTENGTSTIGPITVPKENVEAGTFVYFRGRSYTADAPLTYAEMEREDLIEYNQTADDLGFRVVIDPSSFRSSP
jgi:serine/threonine protein kinase/formylglycine-generating enzyme required for sulfatase activity